MSDPVSTFPFDRSFATIAGESEEQQGVPGVMPPSPDIASQTPDPPEAEKAHDESDDEHLQQYLAKFLKAYNIGPQAGAGRNEAERDDQPATRATPPVAAPTRQPVAAAPAGPLSAAEATTGGAQPPDVEVAKPLKNRMPVKSRRSALPPESHEGLEAMRRLANFNARVALKAHALRQSVGALRFYWIAGVAAIATSATLALRVPPPRPPRTVSPSSLWRWPVSARSATCASCGA